MTTLRTTPCCVCGVPAWRETDPIEAPGHSEAIPCACAVDLSDDEYAILKRAAHPAGCYVPRVPTYAAAATSLMSRRLVAFEGRVLRPTERGMAAITCSVGVCR